MIELENLKFWTAIVIFLATGLNMYLFYENTKLKLTVIELKKALNSKIEVIVTKEIENYVSKEETEV